MTMKELAEKMAELAKEHPNLEVWMSKDDEGNYYRRFNCRSRIRWVEKDTQYGTGTMYDSDGVEELVEYDGEEARDIIEQVLVLYP